MTQPGSDLTDVSMLTFPQVTVPFHEVIEDKHCTITFIEEITKALSSQTEDMNSILGAYSEEEHVLHNSDM